MTPDALLDTNVLLRHVLSVHPDHSPRATALVEAIERGERAVRLSDTVGDLRAVGVRVRTVLRGLRP